MPRVSLTKRFIDQLEIPEDIQVFHDTKVTGLHLRVSPSGSKTFYLYFRTKSGKQKRPKLGVYGILTVERARDLARAMLGELSKGNDPTDTDQVENIMLADFFKIFEKNHINKHVKSSTAKTYRSLFAPVIEPILGKKLLEEITRSHVEEMVYQNDNRRTTANHALVLLRLILDKAQQWEFMSSTRNPCSNVTKFKTQTKERFLSDNEITRLIETLDQFEGACLAPKNAITIVRLLMMTGCRKNEIGRLRWDELFLDEGVLKLKDSKTGKKEVVLSDDAINILSAAPINNSDYIFPGKDGISPIQGLQKIWERIRRATGLQDVRVHDLRHTFASVAVSNGAPLYEVGRLLGHASIQSTQRYAHLERSRLKDSLNKFSEKLK
ncbi:site-specific integrase [Alphaproteobacteria bacterium]|nr:site-specific integrase [Alphaproteobacteria bacterium]